MISDTFANYVPLTVDLETKYRRFRKLPEKQNESKSLTKAKQLDESTVEKTKQLEPENIVEKTEQLEPNNIVEKTEQQEHVNPTEKTKLLGKQPEEHVKVKRKHSTPLKQRIITVLAVGALVLVGTGVGLSLGTGAALGLTVLLIAAAVCQLAVVLLLIKKK